MTAEVGRMWSLPAPMVAAYQYRAFPESQCDERLAFVIAAGATAVSNAPLDEDQRSSIEPWCETLGVSAKEVQAMAILGEQQKERVRSLASNMTR